MPVSAAARPASSPRSGISSPARSASPAPRRIPAHRNSQYLRYLSGATLSALGDQFWYVALSYAAVRTASPAAAGLVLSLSAIPRLLLVLFGGVIVDRCDVRKLMAGSDALRTVVCLVAAVAVSAVPGLGFLAVVAVVFGIVDAVFLPASAALRPRLLEPHQYSGGAVLATLSGRLALLVGAPLGGVVAASAGLPTALLVDAASFAASMAAVLSVRPRPISTDPAVEAAASPATRAKEPFFRSFLAGLSYLRRHAVLGPFVLWTTLGNIGMVGPLNVGAALLAARRGWGAPGIGLLLTGFGVGAAVGAVAMGKVRVRCGLGTWLAVAGAVQGVAGAAMALVPSLGAAIGAATAVGVLSSAMGVPATVLQQAETKDEFRGRVQSVMTLLSLGIVPLTMALMGVAVSAAGLRTAFVLSGLVEVLGLVCLASQPFRAARVPR
ncbi:MAG: MFS transporter [Catenulispora sp.]|nr:MFS transporter [Catenulispora sp.]